MILLFCIHWLTISKTSISEWSAQQSGTEVLVSCSSVSAKNSLRGHEIWGMFTTELSSCALDCSEFGSNISLWSDLLYSLQADSPSLQTFQLCGSLGFAYHTSCLCDSLMVCTLFFCCLLCSLNSLGLPSSRLPSLHCVSWKNVHTDDGGNSDLVTEVPRDKTWDWYGCSPSPAAPRATHTIHISPSISITTLTQICLSRATNIKVPGREENYFLLIKGFWKPGFGTLLNS